MIPQYDISGIGDLSHDGVFIFDWKAGSFVYVNQPLTNIFKTTREELMQRPDLILPYFHSEDKEHLQICYTKLLRDKTVEMEFRVELPEGILKHLCIEAYLIKNTSLITGFVEDITRNKEHEDYIVNYGAKKDTLLDMMSHNLSGPLNLTKNILRWMQDTYSGKDAAEIKSQLRYIQDNTQQCLDIINDLLKEEHLESERIYVKKTRFDLLDRIVVTIDKMIATNKDKKFRLITDLENLYITTDSVKFFQIIHNLISNAVKFTPKDGEIDVIVEEQDDSFRIHVKDNGIGIPAHLQPRLFDRKTPARREGLNKEASSGIGLSIVKTLVELLDGKVWFSSEEDQGSVFSIELPKE